MGELLFFAFRALRGKCLQNEVCPSPRKGQLLSSSLKPLQSIEIKRVCLSREGWSMVFDWYIHIEVVGTTHLLL